MNVAHRASRGTTLVELVVVLAVLGVLIGLAAPRLGRALDRYAASSARDALAAGVARTRAAAVARGGAVLVVDTRAGRFWIEAPPGEPSVRPVELSRDYGVSLTADGADGPRVDLRFDGLGLGRMTSRTLRVLRGGAEARLTLSAYGRVRRW